MKILFVTWDGPQVTYLESLFIPIFSKLADEGIFVRVLQFTWGRKQRVDAISKLCEEANIGYQAVLVYRNPRSLGALLSTMAGVFHIRKAVRRYHIDFLLARSILPAFSSMLALTNSNCGLIFDADGLPLDERVDFSEESQSGFVYRFLRDIEAEAVRRAELVLTRTHKAADILLSRAGAGTSSDKFHVVGNGRDQDLFKPANPSQLVKLRFALNLAINSPLIVYTGSLGAQYCIDEMLILFGMVFEQRPDAQFLILTGSPEILSPFLRRHPKILKVVRAVTVRSSDIPSYLRCSDVGLALRKPTFSMQAVAPIKLGEYLLCGVPVVATRGVGNTEVISNDAGILLQSVDSVQLKNAADWIVNSVLTDREAYRKKSRVIGLKSFSLESTAANYYQAFQSLSTSLKS